MLGITRDAFNDLLINVMLRAETEYRLMAEDESFLNLCEAMAKLRVLRWNDDDEERLVWLEARAFRLTRKLYRLIRELEELELEEPYY